MKNTPCKQCGYTPENVNHSCIGRLILQKEKMQKLIEAYRLKRKYDGFDGRIWSAVSHYDAEQEVDRLERTVSYE